MLSIGTPNERLYKRRLLAKNKPLSIPSSSNDDNCSKQLIPVLSSPSPSSLSTANRIIKKSLSLIDNGNDNDPNNNNPIEYFKINIDLKRNINQNDLNSFIIQSQASLPLWSNLSLTTNHHLNNHSRSHHHHHQYQLRPLIPSPLVIAGPSGSGKSTLLKRLMNDFNDCFGFSISHTTRKPRNGEQHGREYYFIDHDEFEQHIANDEFIEYTRFSNNYYGTSKKSVKDVQNSNKICILDVEIDGVKNLKKTDLNPRFVFIKPPNLEILEQRLRSRGTETEHSLQQRLQRAIDELKFGEIEGMFDLIIVNDDIEKAYNMLRNFVVHEVEALKKSRGM